MIEREREVHLTIKNPEEVGGRPGIEELREEVEPLW